MQGPAHPGTPAVPAGLAAYGAGMGGITRAKRAVLLKFRCKGYLNKNPHVDTEQ